MEEMTKNTSRIGLIALTWPIFAENILRMLLMNVDTIMLSRYSPQAVAAVGSVSQILSMMFLSYMVIATGASLLVAQLVGAGQLHKARQASAYALVLNLLFGIAVSLLVSIFGTHIVRFMNLPAELHADATTFLRVLSATSFVQALLATAAAILRSHGMSKQPMVAMVVMNILNVAGNALVLYGGLSGRISGVLGVALSTAISQMLVAVVMVGFVVAKIKVDLHPGRMWRSLDKGIIRSIYKVGIPSAGENIVYQLSQFFITCIITLLGTEALTTRVITFNIMFLIMITSMSISQGTQIMVGHQVGAGRFEEAYRTCLRSLKIGIAISTSVAIACYLASFHILQAYTSDARIIEMAHLLLAITIILEPGRVFNMVIIGSLKAAGDAKFPAVMGMLSMSLLAVGLSYLLGIKLHYGLIGIWFAFVADEWLRGIVMTFRWRSRVWQQKVLAQPEPLVAGDGAVLMES
jgi:putative MATE family efflux protein